MNSPYCIYKYTHLETGEILYIGKTDVSLKQRIHAHEKEEKFQPYRGLWKISFFWLSNKTETDIVEKFLINLYKPVLNEKDKEEGISLFSIRLPEWISYELYEEELKKDAVFQAQQEQIAKMDIQFLEDALDACAGDGVMKSRFLHPTGKLPFFSDELQITMPNVRIENSLYVQTVYPEMKEKLTACMYEIERSIYAKYWREMNYSKEEILLYEILYSFAEFLKEYAQNGFYEDEISMFCEFRISENAKWISDYFSSMFFTFHLQDNNSAYVELNPESMDLLPEILERIAKDELTFYKSKGLLEADGEEYIPEKLKLYFEKDERN